MKPATTPLDYLTRKPWNEELTEKLWISKGVRFRAAKRCLVKARWSQLAIAFLTSYIIILSTLPYYLKDGPQVLSQNVLTFITTATSIVLLAYTLMETGNNYPLQAYKFQQCAIQLSEVYNAARATTLLPPTAERSDELKRIAGAYENIMHAYENHESIDYRTFRLYYPNMYESTPSLRFRTWSRYYFSTLFVYHVLVALPPLVVTSLYLLPRTG